MIEARAITPNLIGFRAPERCVPEQPKKSFVETLRDKAQVLTSLIQRDREVVARGLSHTRDTIASHLNRENTQKAGEVAVAVGKQVGHYVVTHKAEIAKNIVAGAAVKVVGATVGAPLVAASAAYSGAREMHKDANMIAGKDIFDTMQVVRSGFDKTQTRTSEQSTQVAISEQTTQAVQTPSFIDRLKQSKVGRAVSFVANAERHAAAGAIAHNAHISRVMHIGVVTEKNGATRARTSEEVYADMLGMNRFQIEEYCINATIARVSTGADMRLQRDAVAAVHKAASARLREERKKQEGGVFDSKTFLGKILDRQYEIRRHSGLKATITSGMAAAGAVHAGKSAAVSGLVFEGLSLAGVETQNPFESLSNTSWGAIAHKVGEAAQSGGKIAVEAITQVLEATTPTASAEEITNFIVDTPVTYTSDTLPQLNHVVTSDVQETVAKHAGKARGLANAAPLRSEAPFGAEVEDFQIQTTAASLGNAPQTLPITGENLTANPPIEMDDAERIITREVVVPPKEYVLTGNLTQSLYTDGIVGAAAKEAGLTAVEYYGQGGSAAEVMAVLKNNKDIFSADALKTIEDEIRENPTISFGKIYRAHTDLFIEANKLKAGSKIFLDAGVFREIVVTQGKHVLTIDENISLSTYLAKSGVLGEVTEPKDLFGRVGSGKLFFDRIMIPNQAMISDATSFIALQEELVRNPDASMGHLYSKFPGAFKEFNGMSKGSSFAIADIKPEAPQQVELSLKTTPVVRHRILEEDVEIVVAPAKPTVEPVAAQKDESFELSAIQKVLHSGNGNSIEFEVTDPVSGSTVGLVSTENLVYTPADGIHEDLGAGASDVVCRQYNDDLICSAHSGVFNDPTGAGVKVGEKFVTPGSAESLRASVQHYPESISMGEPTPTPIPQTTPNWPLISENSAKGSAQIEFALNQNTGVLTMDVNGQMIPVRSEGGLFREDTVTFTSIKELVEKLGIADKLAEGQFIVYKTCAHHYWKAFDVVARELGPIVASLGEDETWALGVIENGASTQEELTRATSIVREYLTKSGKQDLLKKFNEFLKPARTASAQQTGTIFTFYKVAGQ